MLVSLKEKILNSTKEDFEMLAMEVFQYQANHCSIYKQYLSYLNMDPHKVEHPEDIPLMPISVFKSQIIKTGTWDPKTIFTSSATTGNIPSRHFVEDLEWYHNVAKKCFTQSYGFPSNWRFLALLPSYLERSGSSLIEMVQYFISLSCFDDSGFFLHNDTELLAAIEKGEKNNIPTIVIGVSFALLDFVEKHEMSLNNTIVMETGGMKGRKKEIPREELHHLISDRLDLKYIHSEYGMTELFSQFYSPKKGIFTNNSFASVFIKQILDPLTPEDDQKTGLIGIIDLGNIATCSFLLTDDLGYQLSDGHFSVIGRADHSEIRGCNLMVSDL